jgi:hypothetical protein
MHYIVGITINFLAVLAASALSEEELRRPWLSGLLLAIVLLNYDAYVFAAAIAAYALFVVRFRRAIDSAVFIAVSAAPVILWTQFLRLLTHDTLSRMIERTFIQPVMNAWLDFLRHPLTYPLRPFLAGHVGLHIGAHFLLAMIYWPVLVLCVAGAWHLRERPAPLVALLLAFYALHQLATAAFDWENNPRRALPAILALAFVYCRLVDQLPRWRAAFVAALAISCVLALADTLLNTPAVAFLTTGQAIQHNPKEPITIGDMRFNHETMPTLMADEPAVWHDLAAARVPRPALPAWVFAQLFNAFFVCALLWLLGRAALLPRWAPIIGAAIWLASVVRFI